MLYDTILDDAALALLKEYCQLPFLNEFALTGGTALALRLGHRRSFDLDLFTTQGFSAFDLQKELESFYGKAFFKRGQLSNALFVTVKDIKSDFVFDYGTSFKPIENIEGIRIYPIEENIAMKLMAISGRGKKRDFFDLFFILKHYSLNDIFDFFSRKFGEEKLIMIIKSVAYFEDAENDNDPELVGKKISWEAVKKEIMEKFRRFKL